MPLNQDQMFVKGYGFFLGKNMSKNISKNVSKNLGGKYNPSMSTAHQKRLHYTKQSATDALKTNSKRVIRKIVETTDLIGNKIVNKIKKNSETDFQTEEKSKERPRKTYMYNQKKR